MIDLGKQDDIFGQSQMKAMERPSGRPTQYPTLPSHHKVLCGYDQGLGVRVIVCETLEDMQKLYDAYYQGSALRIDWYTAPDPGFVSVISSAEIPAS